MIKDFILRGWRILRTRADIVVRFLWDRMRPRVQRAAAVAVTPALQKIKTAWGDHVQRNRILWYGSLVPASVIILLLIHKNVYSYMDRHENFRVDFQAFHQGVVPPWARPLLGKADKGVLDLPADGTLLDSDTVATVTRALEKNPWVEKVTQAQRIYPDRISVTLTYRTPVVAVEKGGKYVLIDQHQVRLPGTYAKVPKLDTPVYPVTGVKTPVPQPGEVWTGDDVQAACDMAWVLDRYQIGRRFQIASFDVSNVNGRLDRKQGEIVLKTADGMAVYWGNGVNSKRFGGIAVAEKLENLEQAYKSYPRFKGLRYVKVYTRGRAIVMPSQDLASR